MSEAKVLIRRASGLGKRSFGFRWRAVHQASAPRPLALPILSASLFLIVPNARAFGPREFFADSGALELMGGANRISISPGFNLGINEWLQLGAQLSYQTVGFGDDSVNTLTIRIGPTIDFGGPYPSAPFAFFGFAMRKGNGTVSDTQNDPGGSGLCLLVGRRVPLSPQFSWRPSAGIQLAGKTTLVINVLAASYFF